MREELIREGFRPEEVRLILERAAQLYEESQRRAEVSRETLEASAEAAGIPEEFVREAIAQLKAERERKKTRLRMVSATFLVMVGLCLLFALFSRQALRARLDEVEKRRAQLEVVVDRRDNLLHQLVSLAERAGHRDQDLIQALKDLQASSLSAGPGKEKIKDKIVQLLSRLERATGTPSDDLLIRISDEITGAENRIAVERKRYNEAVQEYHRTLNSFPVNLFGRLLGYPRRLEPSRGL